ncbi:MAG: MBL fold metallo-hydrolase [Reichenbachiella sp.]|uniref:MBL fold metallo-hydrolase n=1 Tax=Reichenbachiella sp. TaxID=2184521 RepID=UPI003263C83C
MLFLRIVVFIIFVGLSTFSIAQKATYIANSGVFVEVGNTKILIDALFTNGLRRFSTPNDSKLAAMTTGKSPYNNLSLALITHAHQDHCDPSQLSKLLLNQKTLNCLTTPQVLDSIEAVMDDYESIHDRTLTFPISRGWRTYSKEGLSIKAAYARHAGKINAKVQDIIFIADMEGKKVLHLGDADMDPNRFDELKLQYEDLDIAFVPFWYMTSFYGAEVIHKYIKAKKIIAVHFPLNGSKLSLEKINKFLPEVMVFQNPGQTVSF